MPLVKTTMQVAKAGKLVCYYLPSRTPRQRRLAMPAFALQIHYSQAGKDGSYAHSAYPADQLASFLPDNQTTYNINSVI